MNDPKASRLPPRQQLVKADKWPLVGELPPNDWDRPWTLSIEGGCSAPRTWSLTELQQGFKIDQTLDIHCVTRWSKFDMKVTGVPLLRLMEEVRPNSDIKFASFVARSDRNHSTSLSLKDIQRIQPMVAWEVDGVPLTKEHGGPIASHHAGQILLQEPEVARTNRVVGARPSRLLGKRVGVSQPR